MKKLTLPLLIVALAACGETAPEGTGASSQGGAGVDGGGGAGATSQGGSSDTGGNSFGGFGGESVTITMASFDVGPGEEVYKCQDFANPFGGDAEVAAFESHMTQGSHHLLLFYKDGATDSALEDCSGLEFAATPYSTQLPDDGTAFPDGVSALITAGTGLRLQSHYLNTTSSTLTAHVEMTFHLVEPGVETQHAGVMFIVEPQFVIAPHSAQTVTHDCNVPLDMNVIKASSHMHKHGTHFEATVGGLPLYDTDEWSDPVPTVFNPAKPLQGGAPLHFECAFQNDSDQFLTFGESAQTNEMCIFVASFYPVPDDQTVTIGCN
ncbi:MAG: hypothetical protein U0271_15170 [Polyangiaceae bacterium]